MSGTEYAVMAYVFGFALLVGYLVMLWIESASIARRERMNERINAQNVQE